MEIQVEDSRAGGPVTEGFINLLHKAAAVSFERRQPNLEAQRVSRVIAQGDLDKLNMKDLSRIFADAGLHFQRLV